MLIAEPQRIDYSVKLSTEQFDKLESIDFLDVVCPAMKKVNVDIHSIEYGGHFRLYFYFSLSVDYDVNSVISVLESLIN